MQQQETIFSSSIEQPQEETLSKDQPSFFYNTLVSFLNKKNVQTLADEICKAYAESLQMKEASLFLQDGKFFRARGSIGIRTKRIASIALSLHSPFISKLKGFKKVVLFRKQGDFSLEEFQVFYLRKALAKFEVDYVVLLKDKQKFLGFLILGKSTTKDELTALDQNTQQLITHLSKQAIIALEQKMFYDQFQQAKSELRQAVQIKDYIIEHAQTGVITIDHATKKVYFVNPYVKKIFDLEVQEKGKANIHIVDKKIDELIAKYPKHAFSLFLQSYKDAKFSRRSLRKPFNYEYRLPSGDNVYKISSVFIKGVGEERAMELVVVSNITM